MRMTRALLREAIASAWSSRVASTVTIVMIAGMCTAILLTTGRTVGAEQDVINSIDSAGTRSIVVRAEPAAGLQASVLDRIANLDGIEWAGAFGPAIDATNALNLDGTRVPVRLAYGDRLDELNIPQTVALPGSTIWGSTLAIDQLGLSDDTGSVVTTAGIDYTVAGAFVAPDYLRFLEPLAIAPQSEQSDAPLSVLVVIAARPDLVAPVSEAVLSVLAVDDPTLVTLTTSEGLATLRALVEGQLGSFGRELVLAIFALTGVLVAAILSGLTALRRKDFGRRRALGASRKLIVALLLAQMALLAVTGAVLGTSGALLALTLIGDPLPGAAFTGAVAVLAIAVGLVAALAPAIAAASRDPIRELRVP